MPNDKSLSWVTVYIILHTLVSVSVLHTETQTHTCTEWSHTCKYD